MGWRPRIFRSNEWLISFSIHKTLLFDRNNKELHRRDPDQSRAFSDRIAKVFKKAVAQNHHKGDRPRGNFNRRKWSWQNRSHSHMRVQVFIVLYVRVSTCNNNTSDSVHPESSHSCIWIKFRVPRNQMSENKCQYWWSSMKEVYATKMTNKQKSLWSISNILIKGARRCKKRKPRLTILWTEEKNHYFVKDIWSNCNRPPSDYHKCA